MSLLLATHLAYFAHATSVSSAAITTQPTGNTFVAITNSYAGSSFAPSDSYANTWTFGGVANDAPDGFKSAWYYAKNAVGGAGHTFTMGNNLASDISLFIHNILGADLVNPINTSFSNGLAGAPFNAAVTTTTAATLLLAYLLSGNGATAFTPNGGYTALDVQNFEFTCYQFASALATYNPVIGITPAGGRANAFNIAIAQAAGAVIDTLQPQAVF